MASPRANLLTSGTWTGLATISRLEVLTARDELMFSLDFTAVALMCPLIFSLAPAQWCGDLPDFVTTSTCIGAALTDQIATSEAAVLMQTSFPGNVVACNAAWERLSGFSAAEACGRPPNSTMRTEQQFVVDVSEREAPSMLICHVCQYPASQE